MRGADYGPARERGIDRLFGADDARRGRLFVVTLASFGIHVFVPSLPPGGEGQPVVASFHDCREAMIIITPGTVWDVEAYVAMPLYGSRRRMREPCLVAFVCAVHRGAYCCTGSYSTKYYC